MRLALALGWSIARVKSEISSRELVEWWIYDQMHPIGDVRADMRAGVIANTLLWLHNQPQPKLSNYIVRGKPPSQARRELKRRGSIGMEIAEQLGLTVHPHG